MILFISIMSQGGGNLFKEIFDEKMYGHSPSIIFFFRSCIKTSIDSDWSWKYVMSAQLKTHLAVHGGGRTMIEKQLIGKCMFNFKITVMRQPDVQRITLFLGFKLFKIFENFKTTFGYYLSNFCVFISFQANVSMFSFYTRALNCRSENRPEKIFRYFSCLSKNI